MFARTFTRSLSAMLLVACVGSAITPDALAGEKKVKVKIKSGDKTATGEGIADGGCTSDDPASSSTTLSCQMAKDLGLLNADGTPNTDKLEKNADGSLKTYDATMADGSTQSYVQSKDAVDIEAEDDKGTKKTVSVKVQIPHPCDDPDAVTLLGENTLDALDATEHYRKPRQITWNNTEETMPGAKEKTDDKQAPVPEPKPANKKKSRIFPWFQGTHGMMPIPSLLSHPLEHTILAQHDAQQIGLIPSGQQLTLDPIEANEMYSYLISHSLYPPDFFRPAFFDIFYCQQMVFMDNENGYAAIYQMAPVIVLPGLNNSLIAGGAALECGRFDPSGPRLLNMNDGSTSPITMVTYVEEDEFEGLFFSANCPSDYNEDGFVTGDDFDLYVEDFVNGFIYTDFNGDGFVTGDDFDAFALAFEMGC